MYRLFICLMSFFALKGSAQEAVVTDVKISFFVPAHTDDKDEQTSITATLYTGVGKKVAEMERCCGNIRYPDTDYTSAIYQLVIKNEVKKSEIQNGYFDIHIDPKGNDKWVFVPTFQVFFSDGTKSVVKGTAPNNVYNNRIVSEHAKDTSFPFHL